MASPFHIFRKYEKVLIATLGLMAMIAFVFLSGPMMSLFTDSSRLNPLIATSKYGDLRQRNVDSLRNQRQTVHRYLHLCISEVVGYRIPFEIIEQRFFGPATERSVVETWLLGRRAEEYGMTVDDAAVNEFLRASTDNKLSAKQFKTALRRVKISSMAMFDAIRNELIAQYLRHIFLATPREINQLSLQATPPALRWDYYERLNRRSTVELAAIPVSRFVDKIADPDQKTLVAFFEKHKENFSYPASPFPGFRQPRKIAVEYVKAEYDRFAKPDEVTDDEIRQYYEQFKDTHYKRAELPGLDDEMLADKDDQESAADKKDETKSKEKSDKAPESQSPEEGADESKKDGSTSVKRHSRFHLVSFMDEEKKGSGQKKTTEKVREENSPEKPDGASKQGTDDNENEDATTQETQYVPLEKVKDEIRQLLARQHAATSIEEEFLTMHDEMKAYGDKLAIATTSAEEGGTEAEIPEKPDLARLAATKGMTAHETKAVSQAAVRDFDIGRSFVNGQEPFARYAYDNILTFDPRRSQDVAGDHYLFWIIEDVKEQVPSLDGEGVRKQAIEAWKMVQARQLAIEDANRFAEKARTSKEPFETLFSDEKSAVVSTAGPFSWMTYGIVPGVRRRMPPQISTVAGVDFAGDDFMRTVFNLNVDQVGVAMNQPKTFAYVIRQTGFTPNDKVLWELFKVDDFSKYSAVGVPQQYQRVRNWIQGVSADAEFRWVRQPEPRR